MVAQRQKTALVLDRHGMWTEAPLPSSPRASLRTSTAALAPGGGSPRWAQEPPVGSQFIMGPAGPVKARAEAANSLTRDLLGASKGQRAGSPVGRFQHHLGGSAPSTPRWMGPASPRGGVPLRPRAFAAPPLAPLIAATKLHGLPAVLNVSENAFDSFEDLNSIEPAWHWLVLPAVTWLYSWVEWHLQSAGSNPPAVVRASHRDAFTIASEHTTKILEAQPDGLAASIWRSMLSLMLHFMARVEKLLKQAAEEVFVLTSKVKSLQEELELLMLMLKEKDSEIEKLYADLNRLGPRRSGSVSMMRRLSTEDLSSGQGRRDSKAGAEGAESPTPDATLVRRKTVLTDAARKTLLRAMDLEEDKSLDQELNDSLVRRLEDELHAAMLDAEELKAALERERQARLDLQADVLTLTKERNNYKLQADTFKRRNSDAAKRRGSDQSGHAAKLLESGLGSDADTASEGEDAAHKGWGNKSGEGEDANNIGAEGDGTNAMRRMSAKSQQELEGALADARADNLKWERMLKHLKDKLGASVVDDALNAAMRSLGNAAPAPEREDTATQTDSSYLQWQKRQEAAAAEGAHAGETANKKKGGKGKGWSAIKAKTGVGGASGVSGGGGDGGGDDYLGGCSGESDDEDADGDLGEGSIKKKGSGAGAPAAATAKGKKKGDAKSKLSDVVMTTTVNSKLADMLKGPKGKVDPMQMRQVEWTIRAVTQEKIKQDQIDEKEKRGHKKISTYIAGHFLRQHGASKDAEKKTLAFVEGLKRALDATEAEKRSGSRAFTGDLALQIFAAMVGIRGLEGDIDLDMEEQSAFVFHQELEKKISERQGPLKEDSADPTTYLLLERAVDVFRQVFSNRRPQDSAQNIQELEAKAALEEEVRDDVAARKRGEVPARRDDAEIVRSRSMAVVQNKVLRGLAKRGQSLKESFDEMDADGSGSLDFEEFVAGCQQLDSRFTEEQISQLMELVDTDKSGSVEFEELVSAVKHVVMLVDTDDFRRLCWTVFCAEMRRSREALSAVYNSSIKQTNDGTVPVEKLKQALKPLGRSLPADVATALSNSPIETRAQTFARGMIDSGFHALGPYQVFRDDLKKTADESKGVRGERRRGGMRLQSVAAVARSAEALAGDRG